MVSRRMMFLIGAAIVVVTAAVFASAVMARPDPTTGTNVPAGVYMPPAVESAVSAVETPAGGIDWTDVLIGVGIGVGALLGLEGVVHLVRHPPTGRPMLPSH